MSSHPIRSTAARVTVCLAMIVSLVFSFAPPAEAQLPVTGTADFRNAPRLVPGSYVDRIVTGDSAWYSVMYTNGTPYEFSVDFQGGSPAGLNLSTSFVAPTLTTIDGPAPSLAGSGLEYPAGSTNVWFIKVSLETSGQVGVEYPIVLTVSGIETVGTEDCGATPGCTLNDELDAATAELAELRGSAEAARAAETTARVQADIDSFRGFRDASDAVLPSVQSRLNRAEATMADLCNPDPFCDPFPDAGTTTPLLGWVLGLAAIIGGGYLASKKFSAADENAATEVDPKPKDKKSSKKSLKKAAKA